MPEAPGPAAGGSSSRSPRGPGRGRAAPRPHARIPGARREQAALGGCAAATCGPGWAPAAAVAADAVSVADAAAVRHTRGAADAAPGNPHWLPLVVFQVSSKCFVLFCFRTTNGHSTAERAGCPLPPLSLERRKKQRQRSPPPPPPSAEGRGKGKTGGGTAVGPQEWLWFKWATGRDLREMGNSRRNLSIKRKSYWYRGQTRRKQPRL